MIEPKMNFYYPDTEVVDSPAHDSPAHGVPVSEAVEPTETTPATTATKKVEPRTRKEHYLAKIAGEDVTCPEPKTRQEHYLNEIANKPTPSGGGGIFPVTTTITVVGDNSYSFSDANHTVTEILEAIAENKLPVLFATQGSGEESLVSVWYFVYIDYSTDNGTIIFEGINNAESHIYVHNGNKVDGAFT